MLIDSERVRRPVGLPELIQIKARALRVSELAALLNVSERQIYKLAAEELIPHFRIAGSIRFDPAAIATWLRKTMSTDSLQTSRAAQNRNGFNQRHKIASFGDGSL